jgi:aryl-alcohol dehydrogenase
MGNCYPQEFIPRLIEASKRGDFPFTDLIKAYPVNEMEAAVRDINEGSVVKAVITWDLGK